MQAEQRQGGSVALETVLALPLLALVLTAVLGTTSVVVDQLAATRAARAAARTVALTGDPGRATSVASATTPGARATVSVRGGVATVTVVVADEVLGVGYAVDATAVAPLEPAAGRTAGRR